jgi:hypothetical protein
MRSTRKETFGVSGPRIKVRFFGGWDCKRQILNAGDWVKQSYAGGVPMGVGVPPMGGDGTSPKFVVWAVKDPTSANLDRIQVIKGWTNNGQSFEKIFDVAWAGDREPDKWAGRVRAIRSRVDLSTATYTNSIGATELKTVQPARLLRRARAGDFDAPLDADPGGEVRAASAEHRSAHRAGARVEFAGLVRPVGGGP